MRYLFSALPLALLLPFPAAAQTSLRADPPTITVEGVGTAERAPDRAWVTLAVETTAANSETAATDNARIMDRVSSALRRIGIPSESISTIGVSIYPQYAPIRASDDPQGPRIIGYRAANTIRVEIAAIDLTSKVIDESIRAGANRVTGVTFGISDQDALRRESLAAAAENAHLEALAVAEALGLRLGAVARVNVMAGGGGAVPMMARAVADFEMAAAPATPVEPGLLRTSSRVQVIYRLAPAERIRIMDTNAR